MRQLREWRALVGLSIGLGIGVEGCPPPPPTCLPPSVMYMGRCLPPCIENGVNYCALPDGAIVDRSDATADGSTDVPVPTAEAGVDADSGPQCSGTTPTRCGMECVDTMTSINHCGACGNRCPGAAAGLATCVMGVCGMAGCGAGLGDCDMNAANGCETTLSTSVTHCGACGNACTAMNGVAGCVDSMCTVATCNAGFGNCDMMANTGCETDTNSTVAHCGRCGNSCPSPMNGVAGCAAGACTIASCNAGFADCDMNSANGCEVATSTSLMNCGACGNVCPAGANGTPVCSMGACSLTCAMGYRLLGGRCIADTLAPRAIAPLSLGDATLRRPTLRWELSGGFDGAVVELCRDRACTMVIETLRVMGTSARPAMALPARSVVFWRMRGRVGMAEATANSPVWLFHTPAVDASSGVDSSSLAHNDVNGDGFDDVAVGSPSASPGGRMNAGIMSLHLGSVAGTSAGANRVVEGSVAGDTFGNAVAAAGDVNGDGYGDLLVAAMLADPGGRSDAGTVALYLGNAGGLSAMPIRVFEGVGADDHFGVAVAGIGDVNGDGYADLGIGADFADPGARSNAGAVSLFHGAGNGPVMAPTRVVEGVSALDHFGYSVAAAGDCNGDGMGDLVVGAYLADPGGRFDAGSASIFHGSALGIGASATRVLEGVALSDSFGNAVASAGDLNGDGFSEVVVGAYFSDPMARANAGSVSVFYGSVLGVPMAPSRILDGLVGSDFFGTSVASAGDINGDGYSELVVGANFADPSGRSNAGTVALFTGAAGIISGTAARVLEGAVANDRFGTAVQHADLNGDGYSDVVVGANSASPSGRANAGTTSTFHGSAIGLSAAPVRVLDGVSAGERAGTSVASRTRAREQRLLVRGTSAGASRPTHSTLK